MLRRPLKVKQNENREETELQNFDKPDFVFLPKGNHDWRQQGYYIVCKSCEIEHASWVGPKKILVGLDEKGQPLFKNRKTGLNKGDEEENILDTTPVSKEEASEEVSEPETEATAEVEGEEKETGESPKKGYS